MASSTDPRPVTVYSTTPQELECHSELLSEEEGPWIVVTLGAQEHQRGSKVRRAPAYHSMTMRRQRLP